MTFTTPWGTLFYQLMPFGLKNIGETYQREMRTIIHYLLHNTMEDYMDDLLGNSETREENIHALRKIFERLEK